MRFNGFEGIDSLRKDDELVGIDKGQRKGCATGYLRTLCFRQGPTVE